MEENITGTHIKNNKILYIYPQASTFVIKDVQFLSSKYRVLISDINWNNKKMIIVNFVKQFFFLLKNLPGSTAVLVMFGGYWSFLPSLLGRIFNKPVFIILGGTDCVSFPEIKYGSLRKPFLRTFIKMSYKLSTRLLPVSKTLVETDYSYLEKSKYPKQGYKYFFPGIKTPHTVINNGYDSVFWKDKKLNKKPGSFVSVASVFDNKRFELKGIDMIFELAKHFNHCTFTVIGVDEIFNKQLIDIPDNVKIISFLTAEEIMEYLDNSQFYLQLSISEGFPNALSEGMLSKCIPIGSNVGAIPEIIGDTGFIAEKRNFELIQNICSSAMALSDDEKMRLAEAARERIVKQFSIQKRENSFFRVIEAKK